MSQQTKNIKNILGNEDSNLGQLIERAKALTHLNQTIQNQLDPALKDRFKIGSYEKGVLYLLTDNAATATELRYEVPELQAWLRQQAIWQGLIKIEIKVHHNWQEYAAPRPPPKEPEKNDPLSTKTLNSLKVLADSLKGDPKNQTLEKSLRRLIASQQKRS